MLNELQPLEFRYFREATNIVLDLIAGYSSPFFSRRQTAPSTLE